MQQGAPKKQPSAPVGVIDVGSNSIKSLVAVRGAEGGLLVLDEHTLETRISAGISKTDPALTGNAMSQGAGAISVLAKRVQGYGPEAVVAVATSAVRDARNGKEFLEMVKAQTGLELRILSGEDEARLIGLGVMQDPAVRALGEFYMLDLGGGSLELLEFGEGGKVLQKVSLQLGAVRLTERFVVNKNEPIEGEVLEAVTAHVQTEIERAGFKLRKPVPFLVGCGGAVVYARSLLAERKGMEHWRRHPAMLLRDELAALGRDLAGQTLEERMEIAALPRQRADIMPVALTTLVTVLEMADAVGLQHSVFNLRYGLAAELLEKL